MPGACPRCSYPLAQLDSAGVQIDQCHRCQGSFLNAGEAAARYGEEAEPEAWTTSRIATPLGATELACPCRRGAMLGYKLALGSREVEVDLCPACNGLWLDANEGPALASILRSEEEARRGAEADAGGLKTYLFQLFTGMPREVYNPVHQRPWLLTGVILMLVVAYFSQFGMSEQLQLSLCLVPARLFAGDQIWGLLSYALLHAGMVHLLGNLYFLWIFGDNVEDRLGKGGLAGVLVAATLLGGIAHALANPGSEVPTLGASGAVSGAMGAYLVLFPRVKLWVVVFFIRFKIGVLWYLGFWVGLQVLNAALGVQGIAWYAHLGGFAGGVLVALALRRPAARPAQAG